MVRMAVAERRALLLRAALEVISTQGVNAATTRAITAQAGMSLASFHYAYQSRDELLAELIAYVVEEESTAAVATLTPGADLPTTIRDGLRSFLRLLSADPAREQAMLELTLYALRTGDLGAAARAQYAAYYKAAGAILDAAAQLTGATWTRPVDEVARFLVTLTDGLTLGWLVHRDWDATIRTADFAATAIAALAEGSQG